MSFPWGLQDNIVLYLNITPFFASYRSSLIEFDMSADGPHMYHIEKCDRHVVNQRFPGKSTGRIFAGVNHHHLWGRTDTWVLSVQGRGSRS